MIKIILVILALLFYLGIGDYLFCLGVDHIGGKEEYMRMIEEDNEGINAKRAYYTAYLIFITVWPLFLLRGGRGE